MNELTVYVPGDMIGPGILVRSKIECVRKTPGKHKPNIAYFQASYRLPNVFDDDTDMEIKFAIDELLEEDFSLPLMITAKHNRLPFGRASNFKFDVESKTLSYEFNVYKGLEINPYGAGFTYSNTNSIITLLQNDIITDIFISCFILHRQQIRHRMYKCKVMPYCVAFLSGNNKNIENIDL